jgi:hypothetical protein
MEKGESEEGGPDTVARNAMILHRQKGPVEDHLENRGASRMAPAVRPSSIPGAASA